MICAGTTVRTRAAQNQTSIDLENSSFRKSTSPGWVRWVVPAGTMICRPALIIGWEKSTMSARSEVTEIAHAAASARPPTTAFNSAGDDGSSTSTYFNVQPVRSDLVEQIDGEPGLEARPG